MVPAFLCSVFRRVEVWICRPVSFGNVYTAVGDGDMASLKTGCERGGKLYVKGGVISKFAFTPMLRPCPGHPPGSGTYHISASLPLVGSLL